MRSADRLREALEREIVTGALPPGSRLDEPMLVRRFGVSRTPVREALNQLSAMGLVEMRPSRSPVVAALTVQDLLDAFEVMTELEGLCGRLAARRATDADRAALGRVHAAAADAAASAAVDAYYEADMAFHDALYRAAHNRILENQLRTLRRRFGPYRRKHFGWRGRIGQSCQEHADIVAAIQAGDPEAAEAVVRAHVTMNGDVLADFLRGLTEPACEPG